MVSLILIIKTLSLKQQAHIKVKLVAWAIVIIQIPGNGRIIYFFNKINIFWQFIKAFSFIFNDKESLKFGVFLPSDIMK
jgi:hypothetical protein